MTVTFARTPRGKVTVYGNDCINPNLANNANNWSYLWFGSGGAGTNDRYTGQSWAPGGSGALIRKTWTTASSGAPAESGFATDAFNMPYNYTRWCSAYAIVTGVTQQLVRLRMKFFDSGGNLIGQQDAPSVWLQNGGVQQLPGAFFVGPANCATASLWIIIDGGGVAMPVNAQFMATAVFIGAFTDTSNPVSSNYFDGNTANGGQDAGGYYYSWTGTSGNSASIRQKDDPATRFSPKLLLPYDSKRTNRNIAHQFIDGTVGATLLQPGLRNGTWTLVFDNYSAAVSAESAFSGLGTWLMTDTSLPYENVNVVVPADVRLYQFGNGWKLDVPFQELSA